LSHSGLFAEEVRIERTGPGGPLAFQASAAQPISAALPSVVSVRAARLERARAKAHRYLKPACLPFQQTRSKL